MTTINAARSALIFVATASLGTSTLRADPPISFTRIADSNTSIPGGNGNFTSFSDLSLSGANVAFIGYAASDGGGSHPTGIYRYAGGALSVVADESTAIPGGEGNFTFFGSPFGISSSDIAFSGHGSQQRGIYYWQGGAISLIADRDTQMPGSTENFYTFWGAGLSAGQTAFGGRGTAGHEGVYLHTANGLDVVADLNTTVPGDTGTFTDFIYAPNISSGNVAFSAANSTGQLGVYASINGDLQVVADLNTPIPGGPGNFTSLAFAQPTIDADNIVFFGQGLGDLMGIYSTAGGLHAVVDSNTMVPGSDETFGSFLFLASVSGGDVAFMGWPDFDANKVIYAAIDGELTRIIGEGDTLDGLVVDNLLIGREALNGDQLGFSVVFDDGTRAAYVATIPEPATALALILAAALQSRRPRRRSNMRHDGFRSHCTGDQFH